MLRVVYKHVLFIYESLVKCTHLIKCHEIDHVHIMIYFPYVNDTYRLLNEYSVLGPSSLVGI